MKPIAIIAAALASGFSSLVGNRVREYPKPTAPHGRRTPPQTHRSPRRKNPLRGLAVPHNSAPATRHCAPFDAAHHDATRADGRGKRQEAALQSLFRQQIGGAN